MKDGVTHGYLLDKGVFIPVDIQGALYTYAWDVNPRGQVVGWFADATGKLHGYRRDP